MIQTTCPYSGMHALAKGGDILWKARPDEVMYLAIHSGRRSKSNYILLLQNDQEVHQFGGRKKLRLSETPNFFCVLLSSGSFRPSCLYRESSPSRAPFPSPCTLCTASHIPSRPSPAPAACSNHLESPEYRVLLHSPPSMHRLRRAWTAESAAEHDIREIRDGYCMQQVQGKGQGIREAVQRVQGGGKGARQGEIHDKGRKAGKPGQKRRTQGGSSECSESLNFFGPPN